MAHLLDYASFLNGAELAVQRQQADRGLGDMVKILAKADFSADMAATLLTYFGTYAEDGVVSVEVTDCGLWLVNPHAPSRQFLGFAGPSALAFAQQQISQTPDDFAS